MSQHYDNWERLVRAVMLKEEHRRMALRPSMESISISSASSSFRAGSTYGSPVVNESFSFSQSFEFPAVNSDNQETIVRSESLRVFVDERSGKTCYMLGPRGLQIASVEDSQSWRWTTQTDPSCDRFSEVAELQSVWWLDIRCKIPSQILPQRKTYESHLVFKLAKKFKGLESAKAMVRFIDDEPEKDAEKRARIVHFDPEENRRGSTVVKRDDGWMEVEIGNFYVRQGENGEVEARLFEKSWNFSKSGLIVGGIEFRPMFRYSDNPIVSKQCLSRIVKTGKTPMDVANPGDVPEYELNPLDIQIRRRDGISKGSYQVAKCNGTRVSAKILDKDSHSIPECITASKHELTLLEKVRHPNVVQFLGAVTQNVPMMIILECHPRGDLASYLKKQGRLSPSEVLRFALDIARGMNYLHECKPDPIIHCDLKPRNILLDLGGLLKVAGFGVIQLSTISSNKVKLLQPNAINRSNPYLAPEIYKDEIFHRSVDVHSFGLILYEMMEGAPLFFSNSPKEAAKLICLDEMRPTFKSKSKSFSPELRELIEECWHPDGVVRPTFSEIIVRLDKIAINCSKQGWWKDTFKLPWK